MTVYKETIQLTSHGKTPTFFDITPQVKTAILNSKIKNGICTVISPHTTCAVFFEEFVHDYTENEIPVNHLFQQYAILKNAIREMGGYEADQEID